MPFSKKLSKANYCILGIGRALRKNVYIFFKTCIVDGISFSNKGVVRWISTKEKGKL